MPSTSRFCHCGISMITSLRLLWIDPEVLAVVQDFWSFPDTLESGTCFSVCWKHVGTTCLSGQVEEGT